MAGLILGIMSNAGSGKDTAADFLVERHGFTKMSLADEMKRICKRVYDFSDEQLWGPSHMRNAVDPRYITGYKCQYTGGAIHICAENPDCWVGLSPRIALQLLGTEWGRRCYVNTWVDITLRDAKRVLNSQNWQNETYRYRQTMGVYAIPIAVGPVPKVQGVVIPDVRFRNEMEAIRAAGGKVIRLVREGITAGAVGVKNHASEMEQGSISDSDLDMVLMVEEGLDNFRAQVDAVVPRLLK